MSRVGCIILAAGLSSRFGGDKLSAEFRGKRVLERALEAAPRARFFDAAAVVRTEEHARLAEAFGFRAVWNRSPERGASSSLKLGLTALSACGGVLFQVADQPLLTRGSVERLISAWEEHPEQIAALAHEGTRGNPCLFPARLFPELLALEDDVGGGAVIRKHPGELLLVEAAAEELMDVDTAEELARLEHDP